MLDWDGNISDKRERKRLLLSEIEEDANVACTTTISSIEAKVVDELHGYDPLDDEHVFPAYASSIDAVYEASSVLSSISPTLDDTILYSRLNVHVQMSKFATSIGSTYAQDNEYLVAPSDDGESLEWRTSYVNTHENESDLLTKVLPSGEKRKNFVRRILHHIFRSAERMATGITVDM